MKDDGRKKGSGRRKKEERKKERTKGSLTKMLPVPVNRHNPVELFRVPFDDDDIPVLDETELEILVLARLDVSRTEGDGDV